MTNGSSGPTPKQKVHADIRTKTGLMSAALVDASVDGKRVRPGQIDVYGSQDNLIVWFNEVDAYLEVRAFPAPVEEFNGHVFAVMRKGTIPAQKTEYDVFSGGKPCQGNSRPEIIIR